MLSWNSAGLRKAVSALFIYFDRHYFCMQMVSLTLLLASSGTVQSSYTDLSGTIGMPLLFVAAFLTVFSLYQYITGLWKYLF